MAKKTIDELIDDGKEGSDRSKLRGRIKDAERPELIKMLIQYKARGVSDDIARRLLRVTPRQLRDLKKQTKAMVEEKVTNLGMEYVGTRSALYDIIIEEAADAAFAASGGNVKTGAMNTVRALMEAQDRFLVSVGIYDGLRDTVRANERRKGQLRGLTKEAIKQRKQKILDRIRRLDGEEDILASLLSHKEGEA